MSVRVGTVLLFLCACLGAVFAFLVFYPVNCRFDFTPWATEDDFDLEVSTSKPTYRIDETFCIQCSIKNLSGEPRKFDGLLLHHTLDDGRKILCWLNSSTNEQEVLLATPDGREIKLLAHNEVLPAGMKSKPEYLPLGGMYGEGTFNVEELGVGPGEYKITFSVMGKSAETNFNIIEK